MKHLDNTVHSKQVFSMLEKALTFLYRTIAVMILCGVKGEIKTLG